MKPWISESVVPAAHPPQADLRPSICFASKGGYASSAKGGKAAIVACLMLWEQPLD